MAFFPQGARFAVSKETIQRRPKAVYEGLLTSLSENEDSYAGYFMEWLWSELFLGHQEPCAVPTESLPVTHAEAMNTLVERFPQSVQRQLSLVSTGCICPGASGDGSGVLGSISSGVSGGISGGFSGGISSGVSGGISSSISGSVSGSISGGISGGISGSISGGISSSISGSVSGSIS